MPIKIRYSSKLRLKRSIKTARELGLPAVVQLVKDPALLQLHLRFNPWPKNFHMPWDQLRKKEEKRKNAGISSRLTCTDEESSHLAFSAASLTL